MKLGLGLAAGLAIFSASDPGTAAILLTNGFVQVGIGPNGELFDPISRTGFKRTSDGYDPLLPSDPRDSWGLRTSLGIAFADQAYYGTFGIVDTTFSNLTGSSVTAVTRTTVGATVVMHYRFDAPNILRIDHQIHIVGSAPMSLLFQRNWDVDIFPTPFDEFSFWPVDNVPSGALADSSYFGFEDPDPAVAFESPCRNAECNFRGDTGGGIRLMVRNVDAGKSARFTFWYGINSAAYSGNGGQDVFSLVEQARRLGITYMIASHGADRDGSLPSGRNSAFIGVAEVPEPATWLMMVAGFGLVGMAARRRVAPT